VLCEGFLCAAQVARGHEVTIHHRLSGAAASRSLGLAAFLTDTSTDGRSVPALLRGPLLERFHNYSWPPDLVRGVMGAFSPEAVNTYVDELYGMSWCPLDLIRVGSITEDRDTRWCNHFYTPTNARPGQERGTPYDATLGIILSQVCKDGRFSAVAHALGEAHPDGPNPHNKNDWYDAYEHIYAGMTAETNDERSTELAETFYTLGHVIHLVQDLSQPSHTRNDAHACRPGGELLPHVPGALGCSAFERFFNDNRSLASTVIGSSPSTATWREAPADYYTSLAHFSAGQFFSDDTIRLLPRFDGIGLPQYQPAFTGPTSTDPYIRNPNLMYDRVARSQLNYLGNMAYEVSTLWDEGVLLDNARELYPQAVLNSAGLLDFFFRGRLKVDVVDVECRDGQPDLVCYAVENVSPFGDDLNSGTFWDFGGTQGGLHGLQFWQELDDSDKTRRLLMPASDELDNCPSERLHTLNVALPPGLGKVFVVYEYDDEDTNAREDYSTTVTYDGDIGNGRGFAATVVAAPKAAARARINGILSAWAPDATGNEEVMESAGVTAIVEKTEEGFELQPYGTDGELTEDGEGNFSWRFDCVEAFAGEGNGTAAGSQCAEMAGNDRAVTFLFSGTIDVTQAMHGLLTPALGSELGGGISAWVRPGESIVVRITANNCSGDCPSGGNCDLPLCDLAVCPGASVNLCARGANLPGGAAVSVAEISNVSLGSGETVEISVPFGELPGHEQFSELFVDMHLGIDSYCLCGTRSFAYEVSAELGVVVSP